MMEETLIRIAISSLLVLHSILVLNYPAGRVPLAKYLAAAGFVAAISVWGADLIPQFHFRPGLIAVWIGFNVLSLFRAAMLHSSMMEQGRRADDV